MRALEADPARFPWTFHYILRQAPAPMAIGIAGFKGKPVDGMVEIGYSVVPEEQGKGIATESAAPGTPPVDQPRAG